MPTSGGQSHVTGPSGTPPMPALRWRRVFPGEERQLAALRAWLASLLPDCPARADVTSVAVELGTNSIRHTASGRGGCFAVEATWFGPVVRVAVADCGGPAEPRVIDDPLGEHGRGLALVRGLSLRTGTCGNHRGRLVWADVPWGDAGAAEPASPQDRYEAAIRDGQAGLASRFAGVPAWFGRSTLQWWALAGGELVAAPSAQELASVLGRVLDRPPPQRAPAAGDAVGDDAGTAPAAGRDYRPDSLAPQFPPGPAPVPRDGRDGIRPGWYGGPRTVIGGCRPGARTRRPATLGGLGLPAAAGSGC